MINSCKSWWFCKQKQQVYFRKQSKTKVEFLSVEENITTVLYTSKPRHRIFYGGNRKIDKLQMDTLINGFDNSLAYVVQQAQTQLQME